MCSLQIGWVISFAFFRYPLIKSLLLFSSPNITRVSLSTISAAQTPGRTGACAHRPSSSGKWMSVNLICMLGGMVKDPELIWLIATFKDSVAQSLVQAVGLGHSAAPLYPPVPTSLRLKSNRVKWRHFWSCNNDYRPGLEISVGNNNN